MAISNTPPPPYYAVIFTSIRNETGNDYKNVAERMSELAKHQIGYLGHESARSRAEASVHQREEIGITVSYWESLEAIQNWKNNSEHLFAQKKGRKEFYLKYKVRICKVERDYGWVI